MNSKGFIAKEDKDYKRLGIEREVAIWEDGMRTSGEEGSYEWWYFDAEYNNGIKVVVIFYTKDRFDVYGPANPKASIDITLPDGNNIYYVISGEKNKIINGSKIKCDVEIDDSYIKYDDGKYNIHFVYNDLEYNCTMTSKSKMWRPDTGHIYFDKDRKYYFAWLVPQPSAKISGLLIYKNNTLYMDGTGYHDHNWGNCRMDLVMNNWYWTRAMVGQYTIIAFDIITEGRFNYKNIPIMYIKKNTELDEVENTPLLFKRSKTTIHPMTKKPIDNKLTFTTEGVDGKLYVVQFIRGKDIGVYNLIDAMGYSALRKYIGVTLHKRATYVRTVGEVILNILENEDSKSYYGEGLWEQMRFN